MLAAALLIGLCSRAASGQEQRSTVEQLERRADSLAQLSDSTALREAVRLWLAAAAARRHDGQLHRSAVALVNGGIAAMGLHDARRAQLAYGQALVVQRGLHEIAAEETTYTRLGLAYRESAQSDSAIASYRAALVRAGHVHGADLLLPVILNDLGYEYRMIGRYDLAFERLREAERRAHALKDPGTESDALNNLGLVFDDLGMTARSAADRRSLESALSKYEAARAAAVDTAQRNDPITLNNIGVVHRRLFHLTGDTAQLRFARRMYDSASLAAGRDADPRFAAQLAQNNALVAADLGDSRADSMLALARLASRAAGDRWWEAMALTERGWLFRSRRRDLDRAVAYLDTAVALFADVKQHAGGDATRVSFADQRYLLDVYDSWTLARIARANREPAGSERTAELFAVLGAMERSRAAALVELVQDLRNVPGAEHTTGGGSELAGDPELEVEGRSLAAAALRSARVLVSFASTADTLVVWSMTRDGEPHVSVVPVARDTLAEQVARLRRMLRIDDDDTLSAPQAVDSTIAFRLPRLEAGATRSVHGGDDDVAPGDTLFGDTLRALAKTLLLSSPDIAAAGANDEVLIVPNGPLTLIPFPALMAGHWGLRSDSTTAPALRLTPSLRLLAADAEPTRSSPLLEGGNVLIVGNPSMPVVRDYTGQPERLRSISSAAREADTIARLFHATALHGRDATEDSIRKLLPKARLVHLATHGYAYGDDARAGDSFIALAPSRRNDGLLTVREVAGLPLLHADLVVLSACETALGALKQAEGTVGLQRAFLGRGARTVLVSLWDVSDVATAELMTRFYRHWRNDPDKPSKALALARAQADVRSDPDHPLWIHPRYWAAFQLVGAN